jgi:hypothetical protein
MNQTRRETCGAATGRVVTLLSGLGAFRRRAF